MRNYEGRAVLAMAIVILCAGVVEAQIQSAGGGYYVAGYGNVYGSFGQASVAQSRLYEKLKSQKTGVVAAAPEAGTGNPNTGSTKEKAGPPPRAVRNLGVFRPDASIDTGKLLADNLGETPEERALIREIYRTTKTEFDKEAAARGFQNNIAGGLTFFTVAATAVYRDGAEPSDEGVNEFYKTLNVALDDIPELSGASDKDKQGFNNMLVGFSGILLATYTEGKQSGDAATLASAKKLAGMLIELVLKANPDNIQIEKGIIVIK